MFKYDEDYDSRGGVAKLPHQEQEANGGDGGDGDDRV